MAEVFRIEKNKDYTVMANHHLRDKKLSLKAKGMLSYMLSLPDDWDYTVKGLEKTLREGREAISSALKELEKNGYLTRKRKRDGYNRLLSGSEYTIYEKPITGFPSQAFFDADNENTAVPALQELEQAEPKTGFPLQAQDEQQEPKPAEPITGFPAQAFPAQGNRPQLSTKGTKDLKEQNTKSIYLADADVNVFDEDEIEEILHENIEYDILTQDPDYFGGTSSTELLDSIVQIIKQPFLSSKFHHRIAGEDIYFEAVRSRFLKLNCEHIKYVYDCVYCSENKQKIKNIQAYLLTALYNAPISCEAYYMAM